VCAVCCGPASTPHALCFACRAVVAGLGVPLAPVLPVRLCPLPGRLYTVLMGYKESPVDEARRRFAPVVSGVLASFLADHAPCVAAAAGGAIDCVLAVPSTARPDGPPLAALAGLGDAACAAFDGARWTPRLLQRVAGTSVGHMRPDAAAFAAAPGTPRAALRGARAVLLDDTYVSGARAQSAAAALRRAGVRAVVIVPVGRVLRPDRSAAHAAFLEAQRAPRGGDGVDKLDGDTRCARCVRAQTPASTE
jgi:hypothetical protein